MLVADPWIHGSATDPPLQVREVDRGTFILRQSKKVTFEAPFLFLLCGGSRALLLDTGAVEDPAVCSVRETVDSLIGADCELVVAHTHGHGDHVAGDVQFAGRPRTTVVPRDLEEVKSFFGFTDWPSQIVRFDLGGRVLEITGSPGHHRAAFTASLDRMVAFCESRPVSQVLGCHIEMTRRPGKDYPIGCLYQPDEPTLPMTIDRLTAVRDAAHAIAGRPGVHVFDDFIIYNGPCRAGRRRLMLRGALWRLSRRLPWPFRR